MVSQSSQNWYMLRQLLSGCDFSGIVLFIDFRSFRAEEEAESILPPIELEYDEILSAEQLNSRVEVPVHEPSPDNVLPPQGNPPTFQLLEEKERKLDLSQLLFRELPKGWMPDDNVMVCYDCQVREAEI